MTCWAASPTRLLRAQPSQREGILSCMEKRTTRWGEQTSTSCSEWFCIFQARAWQIWKFISISVCKCMSISRYLSNLDLSSILMAHHFCHAVLDKILYSVSCFSWCFLKFSQLMHSVTDSRLSVVLLRTRWVMSEILYGANILYVGNIYCANHESKWCCHSLTWALIREIYVDSIFTYFSTGHLWHCRGC